MMFCQEVRLGLVVNQSLSLWILVPKDVAFQLLLRHFLVHVLALVHKHLSQWHFHCH